MSTTARTTVQVATSADGTAIAYESVGSGPSLVLVDGAMCYRRMGSGPRDYYSSVSCPTLVMAGGKSPAYMRNSQEAIAEALPIGRLETLPGQTHMVKAKVVAPVVASFLGCS